MVAFVFIFVWWKEWSVSSNLYSPLQISMVIISSVFFCITSQCAQGHFVVLFSHEPILLWESGQDAVELYAEAVLCRIFYSIDLWYTSWRATSPQLKASGGISAPRFPCCQDQYWVADLFQKKTATLSTVPPMPFICFKGIITYVLLELHMYKWLQFISKTKLQRWPSEFQAFWPHRTSVPQNYRLLSSLWGN